ncbi:S-adenosylmethionine decarboxylase proenzyme [Synechococcus phage Syn30]|uniref:S-adenosylmethionine decarboxylase proenzyme n=1 Tax=Synechococcus phage Syn30 TaxID=536474 RepID=M4SJU8_9CAUD|nr:S-adenosylmethionine decarboxylase [Synechococcus phage Syn30]AGH56238.1 S-adenosylmethionine decarboxylase proenzyme [Synechococcus phage Syn30]|tara:strand:- start:253 stop:594 length:342 start_codon:yes stop_codon:yes gene_type:complete
MKHILFTLKGCPFSLCDDESHIRNMLVNAATMGRCTLLDVSSHKFNPYGVTAIALLAESHISIHTWPEKCMAVCDVFTCGENNLPDSAAQYMFERMEATEWEGTEINRKLDDE